MRSSKSRSRSKSNRQRSPMGNVVNRVFDSSGPEGKVRGTPQQIIDKYSTLARDAQLSNDRVAAENFLQHAEHYTRLLGEAQRELEARREQNAQNQQQHQAQTGDQPRVDNEQPREPKEKPTKDFQPERRERKPAAENTSALGVVDEPTDGGLVETPEMGNTPTEAEEAPAPKPRRGRGRPKAQKPADVAEGEIAAEPPKAAE